MPPAAFFQKLGFFVLPNFLEPEHLSRLRREIATAPVEKASVAEPRSDESYLKLDIRRVDACLLSKNIRGPVQEKLRDIQPELERHFGAPLGGCEQPQYLIYRPGDFFKPHKDVGGDSLHEAVRCRRVSVVIFLNRQSQEPSEGAYGGGDLTFYGLLPGPQWEKCAFPLEAEPGLLIAFPSDSWHEVKPISHGQRATAVTWFFAPPSDLTGIAAETPAAL